MTILQTSMILTRASNTYSQLRYIVGLFQEAHYVDLLQQMDSLYGFSDTEFNREKLKTFLDEYSDDIYHKSTKENDEYKEHYDLKLS